jgi:hypothetical protein
LPSFQFCYLAGFTGRSGWQNNGMEKDFHYIELRVPTARFENWEHFIAATPEYSIGLEVIDDTPGLRGNRVHFDHHAGVIREATMSAAIQAYIAVRQGRLMQRGFYGRIPGFVGFDETKLGYPSYMNLIDGGNGFTNSNTPPHISASGYNFIGGGCSIPVTTSTR